MATILVSIVVVITPTGTPTAGLSYPLNCSVTGTSDPATYQWFNSNGTQLTNTSQLQFSPLLASHAGTYTCRATVGSVVVENNTMVEINCKIYMYIFLINQDFVIIFCSFSPSSYCCVCHCSTGCDCRNKCYSDLCCGVESSSGCSSDCQHRVEWTNRCDVYAS